MTNAPEALLAPRRLLLAELGPFGLAPAEVGIVGDSAHRGGYHCGSNRVDADDYSVRESPRDKAGLTLDAAALDVGEWAARINGELHNLQTFSVWCVGECEAGADDTRDIREIIYSPDGRTVKRWDRLGKRSTGDSSHRWHTHFSFFRDAIKAGRDQSPLFRRYLSEIGLIDVPLTDADHRFLFSRDLVPNPYGDAATNPTIAFSTYIRNTARSIEAARTGVDAVTTGLAAVKVDLAAVKTAVTKLSAPQVDAAQVAQALAGNTAFIAAIARAVNDDAARRLAG